MNFEIHRILRHLPQSGNMSDYRWPFKPYLIKESLDTYRLTCLKSELPEKDVSNNKWRYLKRGGPV